MQEQGLPWRWRGSWQQMEKEETKPEGRTPTAEAAGVVQGAALLGSEAGKSLLERKGSRPRDDT